MIFLIESVVTDKLRAMGLIAEKPPAKKKDMIRKLTAMAVFAVLFALLMHYVNGITTFGQAALTVYGLWLVADWYDFLVVDILLAPFDKFYKAFGVSAFDRSAVRRNIMKYKIKKGSVQETLLIPLYGRMMAMDLYPDLFADTDCQRMFDRIDFEAPVMSGMKAKIGAVMAATRQYDMTAITFK